jgi:Icc-related predicted phosphoesterase
MLRRGPIAVLCLLLGAILLCAPANAQVRIAQLSDIHLELPKAPEARAHLIRAIDLINERHPDAVVVSGDMAENSRGWEEVKRLLRNLTAPVYYVPGNHDVHTFDLARYRSAFGKDYYTFRVKNVTFVVINSQLLGNYDLFGTPTPQPMPPPTQRESKHMLDWMRDRAASFSADDIVIGLQHIPAYRSADFPDAKPYWIISDPYRSQEIELLRAMNIRHVLAGHWHLGRLFDADGITWHVGPATSWLPWGGELGFAMHTIGADGSVETEFVDLNDRAVRAVNMGESPESLCKPDTGRSVRICAPQDGAAVKSPFRVIASARGNGLLKVIQVYADGEKRYETSGDLMSADIALPRGRHEFIVQGLDDDGFFKKRIFVNVE